MSLFVLSLSFGCQKEELQKYCQGDFCIKALKDLKMVDIDGYEAYFYNDDISFAAIKDPFTVLQSRGWDNPTEKTLEDYGKRISGFNDLQEFTKDKYNNLHVTYVWEYGGINYYYYTTIRKTSDAFWLINFCATEDQKDDYAKWFVKWANTIELK